VLGVAAEVVAHAERAELVPRQERHVLEAPGFDDGPSLEQQFGFVTHK
jgi:hypothetical protein